MALLALLAVVSLGSSWYLLTRLNDDSVLASATARTRNAEVLLRAKHALIGYVAAQTNKLYEDNPGALPCPEHPWYVSLVEKEGGAGPSVGVPNPGYGTANCSSIGRYPWRSIGTQKFVDASGEPLWYVVGPNWRKTSASTKTIINSNTTGDLSLDGENVVALIIAPGPAVNLSSGVTPSGLSCGARSQARSAPAGTMDPRDYLDCYDLATLRFTAFGAGSPFNDQVIKVTVADIMPAIEAAIANRIEREIIPLLNTVYTPSVWGFSGSNPLYPFAAPFANPGPGAGTSSFAGSNGTYLGLLPFNQVNCTASASNPRCLPGSALTSWAASPTAYDGGGWGYIQTQSCWWETGNAARVCQGEYHENSTYPANPGMRIEMEATLNNVAMGLRAIDPARMQVEARNDGTTTWEAQTVSYAVTMNPDGSARIRFWADLPNIDSRGWGSYAEYRIRIERLVMTDHALLDPNDTTTGWFARNEWFRLLYYAVSQGVTAANLPSAPACTTGSTCLTVANTLPANNKRALLILAGRSVNGTARPSATLGDYLEFGNAGGSFERQTITPAATGPLADSGSASNYSVAMPSLAPGATFYFRATNASTGPSTLTTAATGSRALVNADGSQLGAGTIRAGAAVQVTWNGTQFRLAKRPFNDRIIIVGSN
jgi:hypothetical protein